MSWDDTKLMFIGTDGKKWAYFTVYVHDKVECHVKMELSAPYTGNLVSIDSDRKRRDK